MGIDVQAVGYSVLICLISIIFEGAFATKGGKTWFEELRQPKYSFDFKVWYVVGGIYYILFGIITYRLLDNWDNNLSVVSLIFLVMIMLLNGASNLFLFKLRSLKGFFYSLIWFTLLCIILFIFMLFIDVLSVILISIYLIWLVYDLIYFYYLWTMNSE
jgi:tryptophan-rich sensory protein